MISTAPLFDMATGHRLVEHQDSSAYACDKCGSKFPKLRLYNEAKDGFLRMPKCKAARSSAVEHSHDKRAAAGSSPAVPTMPEERFEWKC